MRNVEGTYFYDCLDRGVGGSKRRLTEKSLVEILRNTLVGYGWAGRYEVGGNSDLSLNNYIHLYSCQKYCRLGVRFSYIYHM